MTTVGPEYIYCRPSIVTASAPSNAATQPTDPPLISRAPQKVTQSTTNLQFTGPIKLVDEALLDWCDRHPKEALDWFNRGYKDVNRVLTAAYNDCKRDGALSRQYFREIEDADDPDGILFGTNSFIEALSMIRPQEPDTKPSLL